jgi:hypothetical protein
MASHKVGVAWYFPDEWERLRAVASDRDVLEDSYEEWATVYKDGIKRLKAAGMRPLRVDVHLDAFLAWCERSGRQPDGAARSAYAVDVLQRSTEAGILLPDA